MAGATCGGCSLGATATMKRTRRTGHEYRLDARDLGLMLVCNVDFPLAARAGMDLERTQTKMTGASHCDFRYQRRGD
ncbi:MAG: L-2-amino-thiazoline-4-carboxylic acid hydrolase [Actinomycetota bacterium]